MTMFNDVRDFHIAFGILVTNTPSLPDDATRNLRRALLSEEVKEYQVGEKENDIIEIADALADIAYIICGTVVSYGLFPLYENSILFNFQAKPEFPENEKRIIRHDEIVKYHNAYELAEINNDLGAISTSLQGLMDAVFACAYIYGIPLPKVFSEVHKTNMAKLVNGVVLRKPNGKVAKPEGWKKPDIKNILFPNKEFV